MSTRTSFDPSQHPRGGNPANSGQWTEKRETDQGDGVLVATPTMPYKEQKILVPAKSMFLALSKFTADPRVKRPPSDGRNGCENAVLAGDWAYATDTYTAIRIKTGIHLDVLDDVDVDPRKASRMCQPGSQATTGSPWGVEVDGQPVPITVNRLFQKSKAALTEKVFGTFTPAGPPQTMKCDDLDQPDPDAEARVSQAFAQGRLRDAGRHMVHLGHRQIGDYWYPRPQLTHARLAMKNLGYRTVEASCNDKGILRLTGSLGDSHAEILIMPVKTRTDAS